MIHIKFCINETQRELLGIRKDRRFVMRCEEGQLHELVENAFSEDQLLAIVKKYGLCDVCNFSGLNMSVSRIAVNCVISALYKYPRLRGAMCYVGSKKGYLSMLKKFSEHDEDTLKLLGVQYICDGSTARSLGQAVTELISEPDEDPQENVLAHAISGMGLLDGILLDENDFGTEKFLQIKRSLKQNVRSGYSPKGCGSVASVIFHEIGHLLDYLCKVSKDEEFAGQYEGKSEYEIGKSLSKYAATSVKEYVAEGFAEYMSNSSPRRAAMDVAAAIERCYQTQKAER